MADVALVYGFGHGDMCAMGLAELGRWQARARAASDEMNRR